MGKKTVAELLVETLARRDVSRIYGVAGDSLNGITDSIRRQDHLRWVHMRHEETAAATRSSTLPGRTSGARRFGS
jgi:pyruvate dehydrogenase (quinone)